MTSPKLPDYLDPETLAILSRCYRGQEKRAVIARAMRMLATADGHLNPNGQIKNAAGGRPTTRRPS